jgi:nucleotide-binding universal stress UspA family protein
MKKIAVLTDFSERSFNAAEYALSLAIRLRANILLYHSFLVPSAEPMSAQIAWPLEDYEVIKTGCEAELAQMKAKLEKKLELLPEGFHPGIESRAQDGVYDLAINEFLKDREVVLIVIANHHKGFASLILGNHTREVLDHSTLPLLVVPEHSRFQKINKIAFATDLNKADLDIIQSLSSLARPFNAEILLTHLSKPAPQDDPQVQDILTRVSNQINYPHIYYRELTETQLQEGLQDMAQAVQADLMVMVHRHKDLWSRLLGSSHSQKLASTTQLPLLIYPYPVTHLPVF